MKIIEKLKKVWYYLIAREKETKKKRERKDREDDVMNAITLSNYIIEKYASEQIWITNLKLQKVLYYVQGYFLKNCNEPAFMEEIYNWHYGPVVPTAYYMFSENGSHELFSIGDVCGFEKQREKNIVDKVLNACKYLSSSALVSKTHSEDPWKFTRGGEIIPKSTIKSYFIWNDPLGIE